MNDMNQSTMHCRSLPSLVAVIAAFLASVSGCGWLRERAADLGTPESSTSLPGEPAPPPHGPAGGQAAAEPSAGSTETPASFTGGRVPSAKTYTSTRNRPDLIQPSHLEYLGAFRLPEGSNGSSWDWSGGALAYNPEGDPGGETDGYPGSLFGMGHDWQNMASEVSIPAPVVPRGDLDGLNRAKTLQPFADIRRGRMTEGDLPSVGLVYLTGPNGERPGVLHYCWGIHFQELGHEPSHGWVALDLRDQRMVGPWVLGNVQNYATTDYLFEIPREWAGQHVKGKRLAAGRFREGGQGGRGPSLVAYDPYSGGRDLPGRGEKIAAQPLLLYRPVYDGGTAGILDGYQDCDDWVGGAWLTAGERSAVIFVGSKSLRRCWYGWSDGTLHPNPENREGPGDRGFWAEAYTAMALFYDPRDLAEVAAGRADASAPQPYATLDFNEFLWHVTDPQTQRRVRSITYDRERNLIYILQFRGDEDRSIIHVWHVRP